MKIRLEKPAVNISKVTVGKDEKARRGALHGKLRLDLYFVYRKQWIEIKITEYVICRQEGFLLKFYYIYRMYSRQSNLWLFIHVYYSQIMMRTFSRRVSEELPRGKFPGEKFPHGEFPRGKLPHILFSNYFCWKNVSPLKNLIFIRREININICNRLYLFISKIDYLSHTFNMNKMHSNKDLDLI